MVQSCVVVRGGGFQSDSRVENGRLHVCNQGQGAAQGLGNPADESALPRHSLKKNKKTRQVTWSPEQEIIHDGNLGEGRT